MNDHHHDHMGGWSRDQIRELDALVEEYEHRLRIAVEQTASQ